MAFIREDAYRPLTAEELAESLGIGDRERTALRALLAKLEEEGAVIRTRSQRYAAPERLDLVVGTLQGHSRGFGYVLPDRPEFADVHIGADGMNGAMDRDRVIARIHGHGQGRSPEGEIIRILRRARRTLVGKLDRDGATQFVRPDDRRINYDILIARGDLHGARDGDKVVVELTRYPDGRRGPEGKIVERIGRAGEPGVDITSVIRKYELPERFPKPVLDEADAIAETIPPHEYERRADLRDLRIVTIDGADAKDLDDAVSLERIEDGGWRLGVHIADVSHYVREGSELDREARGRGTSVYLLDRVVPMLPPRLSNGICSLNPHADRLTLSVIMDIGRDGHVASYSIMRSVIKTQRRMTYDEVNDLLAGGGEPGLRDLAPWFRDMRELAELLGAKRRERGAIDFDFAEEKIVLDHTGWPVEVEKVVRGPAERIIEEFMIIANETVARRFATLGVPFVYRVHERPAADRLEQLNEFLGHFGLYLKGLADLKPKALQAVLRRVEGRPEAHLINTVVLRSLRQAIYYEENLGHFGLASECYTHFTSPIRRYPDLAIHRIIGEFLDSGRMAEKRFEKLAQLVPVIARQSSERERSAAEAEREVADLKKVEYMADQIGAAFDGIIAGVTAFGLFVELPNGIQGLVHVSNLTDDYYHYDEKAYALIGERTGRRYRIGDQMPVVVANISVDDRTIDFLPLDEQALAAGEGRAKRDRRVIEQAARAVAKAQREGSLATESRLSDRPPLKGHARPRHLTKAAPAAKVKPATPAAPPASAPSSSADGKGATPGRPGGRRRRRPGATAAVSEPLTPGTPAPASQPTASPAPNDIPPEPGEPANGNGSAAGRRRRRRRR
ncbi:MAG: ribonuclease R [Chloroflexota bacterium]